MEDPKVCFKVVNDTKFEFKVEAVDLDPPQEVATIDSAVRKDTKGEEFMEDSVELQSRTLPMIIERTDGSNLGRKVSFTACEGKNNYRTTFSIR